MASPQWSSFFRERRNDAGIIQASFETPVDVLTRRTLSHFDNIGRFTTFLAGSHQVNFLVSPGGQDELNLLHQGFVLSPDPDQDPSFVFLLGNYAETAQAKVLPHSAFDNVSRD